MNREANIVIPYLIGDTQKKMTVHAEVINNIIYKDMYPAVMDMSNKYNFFGSDIVFLTPWPFVTIKNSPSTFSSLRFDVELGQDSCPEDGGTACVEIKLYWPVEQIGVYRSGADKYNIFLYCYDQDKMMVFYSDTINIMNNSACPPAKYNDILYQEVSSLYLPVEYKNKQIYLSITPSTMNEKSALDNSSTGSSFFSGVIGDNINIIQSIDYIKQAITYNISYKNTKFSSLYDRINNLYFKDSIAEKSHTSLMRVMIASRYNESMIINKLFKFDDKIIKNGDEYSIPLDNIFGKDRDVRWMDGEGYIILSSLEVYTGDVEIDDIENDEYSGLTLSYPSNQIPLITHTLDIISFPPSDTILSLYDELMKHIDNMSTTIQVPNIIENNTITITQPTGSGSGVVKPVFVRAYPLDNIVLHRDVKENISIDLSTYLGKVNTFYLKVCGVYFPEYSRLYDGVVFNVNGNVLTSTSGTYYICDEDKNLVTTGKFTVE